MKKFVFTIFTFLMLLPTENFCISPSGCGVTDIFLVIKSTENPRYSSSSGCQTPDQVAGMDNSFLNLFNLVNNFYTSFDNPYYFHYGSLGTTKCVDDTEQFDLIYTDAWSLKAASSAGCSFTLWIDLASQCHQCHTSSATGTWWKRERSISASEARTGNIIDLGNLPIENARTSCNDSTTYGCGSGEIS